MKRQKNGLIAFCLTGFLTGCASSPPPPVTGVMVKPPLPSHLTAPLPAPKGGQNVARNRDLITLVADYEALRQRMNADRIAVERLWQGAGEQALKNDFQNAAETPAHP